jgi:hypothetical protein
MKPFDSVSVGKKATILSLMDLPAGAAPAAACSKPEESQTTASPDYEGEYKHGS